MSNIMPKPKPPVAPPPPPPPPTPAQAATDATTIDSTQSRARPGAYSSLVSTTPQGLTRKGSTAKTSLIGGM